MKKNRKSKDKEKPMPILPPPFGGPRPPCRTSREELILKPETWKRINAIAANPEKYLNDETAIREEWGLK